MMKQKKSQVTIFIIVGLIILIGGAVFFYSTKKIQEPLKPEEKLVEEQVPAEFESIRSYVNDCAYSTALKGLTNIGEHGGYTTFTDRSINKEADSFKITPIPTQSDAAPFTINSNLQIAYWWYLKSPNTCTSNCLFTSKRPELRQTENSIEKQLERFIDSKIRECINNFEPFIQQGYKITEAKELGELKSDVTIASDDVLVVLNYPIKAERQDTKVDISKFLVRVPVGLDKIYDLASRIKELDKRYRFLEGQTLNLISGFSGIAKEKLPPMADMDISFGSAVMWLKNDVKNRIIEILEHNMQKFQVDGTSNYHRDVSGDQLTQKIKDSEIIPVTDTSFRNLEVGFQYLNFWPIYFDLNCNGQRCVPSSASAPIPIPIGIQNYNFVYDVSFPVMVEITDPSALNNQGYTFRFLLEGNVRNNEIMQESTPSIQIGTESDRSQLCDLRTSGDVELKILDAATKKPIGDAQVTYTVAEESCFIGATDANGALKQKFPVALGGVVDVAKEGYIGKSVEFDAQIGADSSKTIELQPTQTKKVVVKKKNVVKTPQGWKFVDKAEDLNNKENAIISLTRISDNGELEFSTVANYEGQGEKSEIELAPGRYTADITLRLDQKIMIPEQVKEVWKPTKTNPFHKEKYPIPAIDFSQGTTPGDENFPAGGLNLEITISKDDLLAYDTIVFYVVNLDFASAQAANNLVMDDVGQMDKIEKYSNDYQTVLYPKFR